MGQKLKVEDLIGKKYGRLTIIGIDKVEPIIIKTTNKQNGWKYYLKCKCDCGNECITTYTNLKNGHTKSCGCLFSETLIKRNKAMFSTANGESVSEYQRLYRIYKGIKYRCFEKKCKEYKYYGARGITIDNRWLGEDGYKNFKEWALTNGYKDDLTIDRIDNNKNYCPENCRWVTIEVQANNKSNNEMITYKGKTQTLAQWCKELNLNYDRTKARLNACHWSVEKSFEFEKL